MRDVPPALVSKGTAPGADLHLFTQAIRLLRGDGQVGLKVQHRERQANITRHPQGLCRRHRRHCPARRWQWTIQRAWKTPGEPLADALAQARTGDEHTIA